MAEEAELIGGRMRERRDELDLTQREVADRMPGTTQAKDISRWENGHHRPESSTLTHIAKALETTIGDLLAGKAADRKPQGATPDVLSQLGGPDGATNIREALSQIGRLLESVEKTLSELSASEAAAGQGTTRKRRRQSRANGAST